MRIWFDLSNSPHVNLFYQLIKKLEELDHEIVITSRPLANTIALLEQKKLNHSVIGIHYGKNIVKKIFGFPIRLVQLYLFLKNKKIDLAVSQSSFHSPIVAKLLRIPSIYTNDNEHALGNIPAFYFATKILIPENLSISKVAKFGVPFSKIIQYPGIKEGLFLWYKVDDLLQLRANSISNKQYIYFRPEPQTAQYYHGQQNFIDDLLSSLQYKYAIIILPRDSNQIIHYSQKKFNLLNVAKKPLSFDEIAANCSLFIGAGGSMTREFAMLGIPTISIYNDKLLDVDKYLVAEKLMIHAPDISLKTIECHFLNTSKPVLNPLLIEKGKLAFNLFVREILSFDPQQIIYSTAKLL